MVCAIKSFSYLQVNKSPFIFMFKSLSKKIYHGTWRGVLNKVLYGEALTRDQTHYPFTNSFGQKRYPFNIPSIDKYYSFHIPINALSSKI